MPLGIDTPTPSGIVCGLRGRRREGDWTPTNWISKHYGVFEREQLSSFQGREVLRGCEPFGAPLFTVDRIQLKFQWFFSPHASIWLVGYTLMNENALVSCRNMQLSGIPLSSPNIPQTYLLILHVTIIFYYFNFEWLLNNKTKTQNGFFIIFENGSHCTSMTSNHFSITVNLKISKQLKCQ